MRLARMQYDTQETAQYYRSKAKGIDFLRGGCRRWVLTTRSDGQQSLRLWLFVLAGRDQRRLGLWHSLFDPWASVDVAAIRAMGILAVKEPIPSIGTIRITRAVCAIPPH